MKEEIATCILFKSVELSRISTVVRYSAKRQIYECQKCGHVQLFPIPSLNEPEEFSKDLNYNYHVKILKIDYEKFS